MIVQNEQNLSKYSASNITTKHDRESFESVLTSIKDEKEETEKEKKAKQREEEIEQFFNAVKDAGGALSYMIKFNLEKIKALLEKRKEELLSAGGYYSEPPLSAKQKSELLASVDKALENYEKELMEELEENSKNSMKSKKGKGSSLEELLKRI